MTASLLPYYLVLTMMLRELVDVKMGPSTEGDKQGVVVGRMQWLRVSKTQFCSGGRGANGSWLLSLPRIGCKTLSQ